MNKTKVGVVSLGCDKNRVDTEVILKKLTDGGFEVVSEPKNADVIVVNTCAFIEPARKEAIDTIFDMNSYRADGSLKKLVVTGCLANLYGKEIFEGLTEADCVCGIGYDICDAIKACVNTTERKFLPCKLPEIDVESRILSTPSHYAYLKIADGCDNFCSYCLIPHIRGRFRSAPIEKLCAQANELVDNGVSELILVAQDVTKYGFDLYKRYAITDLLKELCKIDGLKRIRLLYCYPELLSDELLEEISTNDKIVKYVDVPLQHVDTQILKKMNRKSDYESLCVLFDKIKNKYPKIAVRSTFICGFPSETQEAHENIKDFLIKYKLYNVGFFAYSREDGTPAAKMTEQIDEAVKQERVKDLYKTQAKIAFDINKKLVGAVINCVIDEDNGSEYIGRAEFQSPDIDGITKISAERPLNIGEYVQVRITAYDKYDLIGEVK